MAIARACPFSSTAGTSNVAGRAASVRSGRYGEFGAFTTALSADVRHLDALGARRVLAADLRVAVAARAPDRRDGAGKLRVGAAVADQRAQVVPFGREQARVDLAVRRQARPRAVAAERLRDRRDD